MSSGTNASRTHVWLEGLGDWSWPGRRAGADALPHPPSWGPAVPPCLEPAMAGPSPSAAWQRRATPRRLLLAALLSALVAVSGALALRGPLNLERIFGVRTANRTALADATIVSSPPAQPLATLAAVSQDA